MSTGTVPARSKALVDAEANPIEGGRKATSVAAFFDEKLVVTLTGPNDPVAATIRSWIDQATSLGAPAKEPRSTNAWAVAKGAVRPSSAAKNATTMVLVDVSPSCGEVAVVDSGF